MIEVESKIKQFVLDNFLFGGSPDDVNEDVSLLDTGIMDSLGVLQLVSFVEETFSIQVEDVDVVPDNFDSVRSLASYTRRKVGVAEPAVA